MCQQHDADSDAQSQVTTGQVGDPGHGRAVRCPRCGLEFRVDAGGPLEALVTAVQQHARESHGHEVDRERVLARLTRPEPATTNRRHGGGVASHSRAWASKPLSGLSATGAVIVIVHIVLAILGAMTVWQWLGGIVVGTLLVIAGLVYLKVRRGPAKPETSSA